MSRPRSFDSHAVVHAAMQALWAGGLSGTSVDDLLRATGLSRSSLYNSFGNRESLLAEAVERYADQQIAGLRQLFAQRSLEQALEALLLDAATSNHEGRGCLLVNAVGELHDSTDPAAGVVHAAFARLADAMEQGLRGVAPKGVDASELCAAVMASIAGLRTLQRAALPLAQRQQAARRLARALAEG
jgi:TetR/AcrR family transcriptional repressor of nem operon